MESFNDIINASQPVLVDFHATWCGPCKALSPVISEVAKKVQGKARVIKVDIDQSPQAAKAYGVQAVPTLIVFQNGEIKWRHAGMIGKQELLQAIGV